MQKTKVYFFTLLGTFIFSAFAYGQIQVLPAWVKVTRKDHKFSLRPNERTSPLLVGDILFAGNLDGQVFAIHREHGYELWRTQIKAGVDGALGYGRSKVFVGDRIGNLYALNLRDGSTAWTYQVKAEWLSPPTTTRDIVLAVSSSGTLIALNERTGKELWQYSRSSDEKMTIRGSGPPVVFGAEVYIGFTDGYLICLSTENGRVIWTKRLKNRDRFYDIDMAPYVDQDSVIASSFDGNLYKLDRLTGNTKWLLQVGTYGGVLVEDGIIYMAGLNQHFYAIDSSSGNVLWKTAYQGNVGLKPVRVKDWILFTTTDDPTYLLDAQTGKVAWKGYLGTGSFASPASHPDGYFYVQSNYGHIYSYFVKLNPNLRAEYKTSAMPSAIRSHLVSR